MAEPAEEEDVSVGLEGSTAQWVVDRAHDGDLGPEELLERVLAAVRSADGEDLASPTAEDLSAVESRLDRLEADVEEMIEDVRQRVIQVKRETDAKAPAEHEHGSLGSAIDAVDRKTDQNAADLADLESTMDEGFENFEEILEFLVSRTDDLVEYVETLGNALVELRSVTGTVIAREQRRAATDRLKEQAAKRGVRRAKCESCRSKIDIALLTEASCPNCNASIRDLDANPGFFGTSILLTGDRPALEAPSDTPTVDRLESMLEDVEDEATRRPDRIDRDIDVGRGSPDRED